LVVVHVLDRFVLHVTNHGKEDDYEEEKDSVVALVDSHLLNQLLLGYQLLLPLGWGLIVEAYAV
jgi:hypothetical protein